MDEDKEFGVGADDAEDQDNQSGERPGSPGAGGRSVRFGTIQELLCDRVYERAVNASTTLRTQLTGSVGITVVDLNETYLLEWANSKPKMERRENSGADCLITISDRTLRRIAAGQLNPQVAMLTDKIRVSGQSGLAVYFFNLVAPSNSF